MYNSSKNVINRSNSRSVMINTNTLARPLLSNRCSYCIDNVFPTPTIDSDHTVGVDMIAIEIPLIPSKSDPKLLLSSIKNTMLGRWGTKATTVHEGSGTKIHFSYSKQRSSITMEFNPSRFMDPDGTALVPVEAVARVCELLVEEYFADGEALPAFAVTTEGDESLEYWEEDWRSQIRIVRLDTARDFVITDPRFSIGLFKETQARYAKGVSIIYKNGVAETWDSPNSKKSGHVKFYDKFRQAVKKHIQQPPAEGTFRFEYLLRKKHLQRAHIHTLDDLTPAKFENALRIGWKIAGLGELVAHPHGWINQVNDSLLSVEEKAMVIGFLQAEETGFDLGLRKHQINGIRAKARSIGLSFRRPLSKQGNLYMQLDLDAGECLVHQSLGVSTDKDLEG